MSSRAILRFGATTCRDLAWKNIPKDPLRGEPLIKNCIEFKQGRRILVEANVCENNWVQAQVGYAIVMTPTFWKNMINPDGTPSMRLRMSPSGITKSSIPQLA